MTIKGTLAIKPSVRPSCHFEISHVPSCTHRPSLTEYIQIQKVSIHTKGYTCRDTNSLLTKTPRLFRFEQEPHISTSKRAIFLSGCHKVITLSFCRKKRNTLKEEVKLETANEWKSVTEGNVTHAAPSEQVACYRLTDTAPTVSQK